METEVTKKLFTVDEYHRMGEAGILTEDDRVELIEGEIVQMSPIGNRHAACVDRACYFLNSVLKDRTLVSIQNPVRLDNYSEPQPDVIVPTFVAAPFDRTMKPFGMNSSGIASR